MLIFWLLAALWGCWRRGNLLWAGYFGWFALCTLPICSGIFGWLAGRGDSHEEFHVAEPHVVLAIFVAMAAASKLTAAVLSCERSAFDESRFSELIRIEPEGDFGTVRRLPSI